MTETTAIIDYGSGNLRSAAKAFERAAAASAVSHHILVTSDPAAARAADRIVLPGVGAFADCRRGLSAIDGMDEALQEHAQRAHKPFLGICVGMQLMADRGFEHGETAGFGWIGGQVDRMTPDDPSLKVPHMGWNALEMRAGHPLIDRMASRLDPRPHAYFVHSYQFYPSQDEDLWATASYGGPVTAIVAKDAVVGVQFHPEKSQRTGLALISAFLEWRP